MISFVAALAAHDAMQGFAAPGLVRLKWPNDVLIAGDKAAGLLIESGSRDSGGLWLAVGMGLNLAWSPDDAERPATSLADHLAGDQARVPNPDEALAALDLAMQAWLGLWLGYFLLSSGEKVVREAARMRGLAISPSTPSIEVGESPPSTVSAIVEPPSPPRGEGIGDASILADWSARAAGIPGPCVARLGHETITGWAEGLADDGALRLRLETGEVRLISAGDVFFGAST